MANIGKMALVVTANAASVGEELDKAGKKIGGFASSAKTDMAKAESAMGKLGAAKMKATDGGGGGGMGGMLAGMAGGAVVAGLGLAKDALMGLITGIGTLREDAAKLGVVFSDDVVGGIGRADGAIHSVKAAGMSMFGEIVAAAEPAITAFSHVLLDAMESAKPVVMWLADKVGGALSLGFQTVAGIVKIVAGQVMSLWESFAGAAGVTSWFDNWPTWEQVVKTSLKVMTTGFAYTFDTVKAGAGLVGVSWGTMAKAAATALESLGGAVSWLADKLGKLFDKLGTAYKAVGWDSMGDKLSAAGEALQGFDGEAFATKWAGKLRMVGDAATATGMKMVSTWGQTKGQIDGMIDGLSIKTAALAKELPLAYSSVAAVTFGSREATSIEAKFKTQGIFDAQKDLQKQQLNEAKQANAHLKRIADAAGKGEKLEVI